MGRLKRIIYSGLRALGIATLIGTEAAVIASPLIYACYSGCGREEMFNKHRERDAKNEGYAKTMPHEDVEKIVAEVNTPEGAFEEVTKRIKFSNTADSGYLASLSESFARGEGDCTEGAIAFAALLSDNPEYEVKVVHFGKRNGNGHYAALFKDPELGWGYASFNSYPNKKGINARISENKKEYYQSIEEALTIPWHEHFRAFRIIEFNPEDLKFGRGGIEPDDKGDVCYF